MKNVMLSIVMIGLLISMAKVSANEYGIDYGFGNGYSQKYKSTSGTNYQYDMSKPLGRIGYGIDINAQVRDKTYSNSYRRNNDRKNNQYGGGIFGY